MSLPILETPILSCKVPVTGEEIEYRPFTVREESLLNIISSGNDKEEYTKEVILTITKLIEKCVQSKDINIKELPLVDSEFLFLKIKEASSGEIFSKKFKCKNTKDDKICGHNTNIEASTDDIELYGIDNVKDPVIQITDELKLVMKLPSLGSLSQVAINTESEFDLDLLAYNIDKVIYGEEVYTDLDIKELKENILKNMTKPQINKILEFIDSLPYLMVDKSFKCKKCGFEHKLEIKDLLDFFH